MKLSICMMIKDEEKNLQRCLMSLSPLMETLESELIIIDTGSEDESPNIAKKFTNKVFFHKWNNDFSEMRNISISYAKGDWILIIDADEELKSYDEIITFFSTNECKKYNTATILCDNVTGNSEYNSVVLVTPRLFKNDGKFKYTGSVHNMPVFSKPVKNLKDTLLHYGYVVTDKELVEKKFKRTATMLIKELEKNPDNVYYRYQLSVSYLNHGDYMEALRECEKSYENVKNHGLNLREHFYIYPHLVKCLCIVNNYHRAKLICEEAIKVEKEQLDMYCYLGEVLMKLNEFDEAVQAFDKYLYLVKNYDKLSIINDTMMYFEKLGYVEKVYHYLVIIYYNKGNYNEVLKYSSLIKLKEIVKESMPVFLESFIKLSKYQELKDYYKKIIYEDKNITKSFYEYLEKVIERVRYNELFELYKAMSEGNDEYSILNKFRVAIVENKAFEAEVLDNYIINLNFNDLPEYYGDILYYYMNFNIDFYSSLFSVNEVKIVKYLLYLENKSSELVAVLERYSESFSVKTDFKYIRVNKIIFKTLMAAGNYDDERYKDIFIKYVELGVSYINYVYNNELIEHEWLADIKNDEEAFLIFIHKANKIKNYDKKSYVMYLRKALKVYPYMKKGIEMLLEDFKNKINNNEFEQYKTQVKSTIKLLINNAKLQEAKDLASEYKKIVLDDIEIYSIDAVILMMEERVEDAELILKEGLAKDYNNFDLLYNLASIYEMKQEFDSALKYYKSVFLNTKNEELKLNIKDSVEKILRVINSEDTADDFLNNHKKLQKCLILCHFYSVFTKEYLEKMYENVAFDILTIDSSYKTNVKSEALDNVYLYSDLQGMYDFLNSCEKYDIIHVHFLTPYYGILAEQIRLKCKKLIVSIWGGDFYDVTDEQRVSQNKLLNECDLITFGNEDMLELFNKHYKNKYSKKINICRFGLKNLENIDKNMHENTITIKNELGLPVDSIIVTVGYSSYPGQNHIAVMESIEKIKNSLPKNVFFIFPMTYGDTDVTKKVKEYMKNSHFNYKIYENFLSDEDVSKIRVITDIMIQVQPSDQLSGSMQEHLYSNGIVITGSWLPYGILKRNEVKLLEVLSVDEVGDKVKYAVDNIIILKEKFKSNKEAIYRLSSWKNTIPKWENAYDLKK